MSRVTFWLLPWRSRSQHDLAAKSGPAHNFVIWSPILKLLHRNDHYMRSRVASKIIVATLKIKVTAWPCSQTCLVHVFVIWSRILQLFDRNDHHIEMICHYLAHSLALWLLYCIVLSSVTLVASLSCLQEEGIIRAWDNFIDSCTL